jgi:hypothetical protein
VLEKISVNQRQKEHPQDSLNGEGNPGDHCWGQSYQKTRKAPCHGGVGAILRAYSNLDQNN